MPEYTQGKQKWVVIDFHSIWKLTASDVAERRVLDWDSEHQLSRLRTVTYWSYNLEPVL